MEPGLLLTQNQSQTLVLTQQMRQSIKILEIDALELREYILGEAMENPAIDLDGVGEPTPEQLRQKKMEWLEQQAQNDKQYVGYYDPRRDNALEKTVAAPEVETLAEHLLGQAALLYGGEELAALHYVAGCLDDDGYLRLNPAEMASDSRWNEETLRDALARLRTLDPPGVGAADLRECLLLQLHGEEYALERALVERHLEWIARGRPDRAARELGVSPEQASRAFETIRRLNPRPGSAFARGAPSAYITPDLMVTNFQDRTYVLPCEFSYPSVRVSASIRELLGSAPDEESVQYIRGKIKQAQWLQKCITGRVHTLLDVTKCIVRHQEDFFRHGPQHLGVLRMSDVAAALELHESTVSRAVKNKYLQCAHGTFPLRHFFVQGLGGDGEGEGISSHTVKCRIQELIAAEAPGAPLSDQKLCERLAEEDVHISRRTVAKYRDGLGIPSSAYRQ